MRDAFRALRPLADGVQLTPGNHPTKDFALEARQAPTRRHHGFDYGARKREVWDDATGECLVDAESVHPPRADRAAAARFASFLERCLSRRSAELRWSAPILETMYPGWLLGDGEALDAAMRHGLPLALDVSHVFIQRTAGVISDRTWSALSDYPGVEEVHVSGNDGRHDSHLPLTRDTFGLALARERLSTGVPVVLECYMHRLSPDDRRRQIDLVRGGAS
jgi:sugar phosphate isomerase/epimerase